MDRNPRMVSRERALLAQIELLTELQGYPPSVRELTDALGLSSTSTTMYALNDAEARGLILRDPKVARSIRIVKAERSAA